KLGDASAAGPEILAMGIPAAKRDRHHPCSGFDQTPGHQEMVHAARWTVSLVAHVADTVALANSRIFPGEVECLEHPARRQALERWLGEAVHSVHRLVAVERAAEAVELAQEGSSAEQALRHNHLFVEAQAARIVTEAVAAIRPSSFGAKRCEWGVRKAEVSGITGVTPARLAGVGREANERGNLLIHRALKVPTHTTHTRP